MEYSDLAAVVCNGPLRGGQEVDTLDLSDRYPRTVKNIARLLLREEPDLSDDLIGEEVDPDEPFMSPQPLSSFPKVVDLLELGE